MYAQGHIIHLLTLRDNVYEVFWSAGNSCVSEDDVYSSDMRGEDSTWRESNKSDPEASDGIETLQGHSVK